MHTFRVDSFSLCSAYGKSILLHEHLGSCGLGKLATDIAPGYISRRDHGNDDQQRMWRSKEQRHPRETKRSLMHCYLLVVLGLVLLCDLVKLACHGYHSNQTLLMVVI
jgi:hypothetical protein